MSRLNSLPFTIEYALLGLLQKQPMHGYQLYQELSAPNGLWQVWRIKQGQLYALLTKLEESGYLNATLESQEARPPRKIFQLTTSGQTALQQWLTTPVARPRQVRQEFLAKLFFVQRAGISAVTALFAAQRTMCRAWQAQEQATESAATGFAQVVALFRLSQVEALLTWLDRCEVFLTGFIHQPIQARKE
jgi:DNA-binding PadR family transcriptional regulator